MAKNIINTAASVHQRLLNKAKDTARPFNELLQHFAIERFIYRLSKSPHADRFLLKGALMFSAWTGLGSRLTMDIDLLGKIDNRLEVIVAAMKDACEMEVEPDGMAFHSETVTAARITEGAEYEGVRCRVRGGLGKVRISLQIDIGTVFDLSFTKDEDKKAQWLGFIKKAKITDAPGSFEDVAAAVKIFLEPIVASIVERQTFCSIWTAPGPWR